MLVDFILLGSGSTILQLNMPMPPRVDENINDDYGSKYVIRKVRYVKLTHGTKAYCEVILCPN